ncbi:Transmembrane exosortase (Exosortase_EpsH) [Lacunisphaera limnophila]|uniref:Transmembrane exosortase (Exosortase_EpsH) n=1 Tax=Lacunisphaera limnophila TaxID=1838286 RepID=A0A1D8AWT2_9BACT|nr:exosortase/archaeosortase family protein [Lacunisphaera limnophila]AOS45352.1 Transmembrane exosortase (Exosortase_EpsH) [Lacunisphaera limnophila]
MTDANQAEAKTEPGPRVPGNFLAALGLAGGFMAFVAWDQSHWWERKEDYSFGWLVPLFTAYMVYDRWAMITARVREAAGAAPGPRWARWTLNVAAGTGLVLGALFFLLGAFYRAGAGTSQPGTFALTLGMVGIVLPLIFFNAGGGDNPGPARGDAGPPARGIAELGREPRFRVAVLFLFPVLVWLISAPLVSAIESQISLFLLRKVVTVVAFSFDLLGYPLEQQGNVLMLPKGPVGVADACSGIRSLTACLFAGSFLGAAFFTEFWKKAVLVGASMGFAFLMNLGRSLFLTGWAYAHGPEAISGTVHDVAGYAVLGLTCAGLLVLVPLLNLRVERAGAGT